MKKILLLAIVAVMLVSCGGQKSPLSGGHGIGIDSVTLAQADSFSSYEPQRSEYSFRTELRTSTDGERVRWDSIIVYLTDGRGLTQTFRCEAQQLDTMYWHRNSFGAIREEDWNFDGIPDLQVCTGPKNMFGNYVYDVWLWNEKAHLFEAFDGSDEIFSPQIDYKNKWIVSTWHLDSDVEIVRYEWKEGKLVETIRESMPYDEMVRGDVLTYADVAGTYDDEGQESRFVLNDDGTAYWSVVGSINYTEYTYRISDSTICLKAKGVDSEEECYDYDDETGTLENEQGTVYHRQITED